MDRIVLGLGQLLVFGSAFQRLQQGIPTREAAAAGWSVVARK